MVGDGVGAGVVAPTMAAARSRDLRFEAVAKVAAKMMATRRRSSTATMIVPCLANKEEDMVGFVCVVML